MTRTPRSRPNVASVKTGGGGRLITPYSAASAIGALTFVLALAVLLSGFGERAWAQMERCATKKIEGRVCVEPADADRDIDIQLDGEEISTTASGSDGYGVYGRHSGAGDISIDVVDGSSVSTSGVGTHGVLGWKEGGAGDIRLRVRGATVKTSGASSNRVGSNGVYGLHTGDGDISIDVVDGSSVSTMGDNAYGVLGWKETGPGDIRLRVRDTTVTTSGARSHGVYGQRTGGTGDIRIDVVDGSSVSTSGDGASGVFGWHFNGGTGGISIDVRDATVETSGVGSYGVYGRHSGAGDISIDVVDGSSVSTSGVGTHGVLGWKEGGAGDIRLRVRGATVKTSGASSNRVGSNGVYGLHTGDGDISIDVVDGSSVSTMGDRAYGVFGWKSGGTGDISIDVRDATVETSGVGSYGVHGLHSGDGDISIDVVDGSSVSTMGDRAYGVFGWKSGGTGDISIDVRDATVETSGARSHGVYALAPGGSVVIDIRNAVVRATGDGAHGVVLNGAMLDAEGNRRQTVTVDSEVMGGSGTGAGIRLTGGGRVILRPNARVGAASGLAITVRRSDPDDMREIPRLYLDLMLGGHRVEKILLGRVVNDDDVSAGTTVSVNGTMLMDGGTVAEGVWAPNAAWDVALKADANGADLAAADFLHRFAPRAAVYEALPGVLLRLDDAGSMGGMGNASPLRSTHTPVWVRIAVGQGSYEPASARVGADYDYDRFVVESGMEFRLPYEELTGWAGVRVVSGSAAVSGPTGGGRIEARGIGLMGGVAWEGEDDWYGRGRLSLTHYSADLTSRTRGVLKNGASALVHGLGLEGGRRFGLDLAGVKTRLTARGVLRRSGVSLSKFEDGLFSRVSVTDADRLTAGAGVIAETGLLPRDGVDRLLLRGTLDATQALAGGTKVDVSGTELKSKVGGIRFGAGLGGEYRLAGYTIGGLVGAGGLGSRDTSYSAQIEARFAF